MEIVKRAIIMAAGKGSRMNPVTLETPKPLVRVNGIRMIDTVIQSLHKNNIFEIYIVVGYLKEKFDVLLDEYQGITLIENPYFDTCNNISSLYVAREYIENSIILDGDQIIFDDSILDRNFEYSGYNCVWTDQATKEWVLTLDENGKVIHCNRNGADFGWQLFSVSRWTKEDGKKLKKHLEMEFENKKNTQIYWDDVALNIYLSEYHMGIRKMELNSIIEIDNFEELVQMDGSYRRLEESK